jgi:hypothetical protein
MICIQVHRYEKCKVCIVVNDCDILLPHRVETSSFLRDRITSLWLLQNLMGIQLELGWSVVTLPSYLETQLFIYIYQVFRNIKFEDLTSMTMKASVFGGVTSYSAGNAFKFQRNVLLYLQIRWVSLSERDVVDTVTEGVPGRVQDELM